MIMTQIHFPPHTVKNECNVMRPRLNLSRDHRD